VPLDHVTEEALDKWLDDRHKFGFRPTAPLFCSIRKTQLGNPMWPAYISGKLARLGREAGIEVRVNPESLRVTGQHEKELARSGQVEGAIWAYVMEEEPRPVSGGLRNVAQRDRPLRAKRGLPCDNYRT
jgi:hypothetical protein